MFCNVVLLYEILFFGGGGQGKGACLVSKTYVCVCTHVCVLCVCMYVCSVFVCVNVDLPSHDKGTVIVHDGGIRSSIQTKQTTTDGQTVVFGDITVPVL